MRSAAPATIAWIPWAWPWRTSTRWADGATRSADRPIDASGRLITGEKFTTIQELKQILVKDASRDFYRCLSEKLLTYALGRGLGYYDVEAVDRLVERLERSTVTPLALDGRDRIGPVPEKRRQRTMRRTGRGNRRERPDRADRCVDREAVHEIDFGHERELDSSPAFLRGLGVCVACRPLSRWASPRPARRRDRGHGPGRPPRPARPCARPSSTSPTGRFPKLVAQR